jgi:hypothetical protein
MPCSLGHDGVLHSARVRSEPHWSGCAVVSRNGSNVNLSIGTNHETYHLSFQRAGIDSTTSFNLNMALNSMFIIGTVASWFRKSTWPFSLTSASLILQCHPSPSLFWTTNTICRRSHPYGCRVDHCRWYGILQLQGLGLGVRIPVDLPQLLLQCDFGSWLVHTRVEFTIGYHAHHQSFPLSLLHYHLRSWQYPSSSKDHRSSAMCLCRGKHYMRYHCA